MGRGGRGDEERVLKRGSTVERKHCCVQETFYSQGFLNPTLLPTHPLAPLPPSPFVRSDKVDRWKMKRLHCWVRERVKPLVELWNMSKTKRASAAAQFVGQKKDDWRLRIWIMYVSESKTSGLWHGESAIFLYMLNFFFIQIGAKHIILRKLRKIYSMGKTNTGIQQSCNYWFIQYMYSHQLKCFL